MKKPYQNINEIVTREVDVAASYAMILDFALQQPELTPALAYDLLTNQRKYLGELLEAHPKIEKNSREKILETIQSIDSLLEYNKNLKTKQESQ